MAGKKEGDKSNPPELSLCLMSIMPPQLIPQTLTCCFCGGATAAHCSFAPVVTHQSQGEASVMSSCFQLLGFFSTKVRFSRRPRRRLSTASPQHGAVNSPAIHTWRIERSKVDRMCNLQARGKLTLSVSVRNERPSHFYDGYAVRAKAGPPAA